MRRLMRSAQLLSCMVFVLLGTGLRLSTRAAAQQSSAGGTSSPGLHQRANSEEGNSAADQASGNREAQDSTLPDDVSGPYNFDRRNESIEIDLDRNSRTGRVELNGYISRMGDDESDSKTPLTFFFDKTSVNGSEIEFQTRVVHGIWYSFQGTIFRGGVKSRSDEGYYVLHGTLNEHHSRSEGSRSADETVEMRTVNYKSMPQLR